MRIINTVAPLRNQIRRWRQEGKRIALVPTMGNLHEGHMTLVDVARSQGDVVVVSIFVNPMQFEKPEDTDNYPRTLNEDIEKLTRRKADLVFAPTVMEVYPIGLKNQTFVEVPDISNILEGVNRPGHYRGVATVVSKLFNLVQPDVACFGEKDYQQLALIRKLVVGMNYDIKVIVVPTVRDKNGLALSSRNGNLAANDIEKAPALGKIMNETAMQISNGERNIVEILKQTAEKLRVAGFIPDELFIQDADDLGDLRGSSKRAVVLMAAWLGNVRLIDNLTVELK